jgi:eukaryotic-like serine/threonine-protein kinase
VVEQTNPNFAPGQRLGPYSIVSSIGSGGMGDVYLASDTRLGRQVALKFLPPSVRDDPERMRRFQHEARIASTLNHPNVATIYEIGESSGLTFIAMEYIDGSTLDQKINGRPLSVSEILNTSIQVADALDDAHSKGIIHRDIKSGNIMITRREQAKVLDFGLAKMTSVSGPQFAELPTAVKTAPGIVMGTVEYMSPEQALGKTIDERSDIWSLGVVLYEMSTGRKPFSGATSTETIENLRHAEPEAIARFNYDVPDELERIIRKCLEKDPESRYQSARDLTVDLKNLRRDSEPGTKRTTSLPTQPQSSVSKTSVLIGIAVAAILGGIVAAYFLWTARSNLQPENIASPQIKSIAVLPFKPLTADKRDETLELGMADTLITKLGNIKQIDLRPISAVRKYTGLEQDAIEAGREQQVDAVIDGVIQRVDDKVRVSVRFVRVRDGSQLWADEFQEKMTEIFAVQDSISERVAAALAVALAGGEREQLTKRPTKNSDAYELYLKGRFQLTRLTDEGFLKGRDYFQQAIERDPDYALAYAALADSYVNLGGYNVLTPHEAFPKAREAAVKALKIDQSLAEPHAALAMVSFAYDWNWKTAEQEFRRALELNPNYPEGHQLYSYYLTAMGRFEDSLAQMQRSIELDPTSLSKVSGVGEILNYMGRTDEAVAQHRKALAMDPNSGFAHWALGNVYIHKRQYDDAITEYKKAIPLSGGSPDEPATLAFAYAKLGKRAQALEVLGELEKRAERSYVPSTLIAATYAALGDQNETIKWLNKAFQDRDGILAFTKVDPMFADIRSNPRYTEVLARIDLP